MINVYADTDYGDGACLVEMPDGTLAPMSRWDFSSLKQNKQTYHKAMAGEYASGQFHDDMGELLFSINEAGLRVFSDDAATKWAEETVDMLDPEEVRAAAVRWYTARFEKESKYAM